MDLHGASLIRLAIEWEDDAFTAVVAGPEGEATITASGLRRATVLRSVPRRGDPIIDRVSAGYGKLEIELRAGDRIVVEADEVRMPE